MIERIERTLYLEKIKPFIGKSLIKVLIGQRRVGKSCLLLQIKKIISDTYPDTQIVYINKELHEFANIKNSTDLFDYVKGNVDESKKVALFIDEIQDIEEFEIALRDYVTRSNFDIYCTGSNSNMLSSDIATVLSGRYVEIKVYSLSYSEYLLFNNEIDSLEAFNNYMQYGGLPYLRYLGNEDQVVYEYLKNIYNTILLKDVISRFKIRNVNFLENLILFIADNTGSIVSSKKISDYLKSQKINISTQVVIEYLKYLESSLLILKVKRSGIVGKKIFEIGEKYYFEDIGIRNSIVGYRINDIHKILENIVFHHLLIAGYVVTVGVEKQKEIDFVAQKGSERIYIQVAYLLNSDKTIDREFGNLIDIDDNYPKYVVTMDNINESATYRGIKRLHVKDFCLKIFHNNL